MHLDRAVEGVDAGEPQQRSLMARLPAKPLPGSAPRPGGGGRDRLRAPPGRAGPSSGGPAAICAPSSMAITQSESCITRSSLCSISRIVWPCRLELADDALHLRRLGLVHAGGRLVEQQQARPQRQRARDLDPAAVGVGQRIRGLVDPRQQPVAEQRAGSPPPRAFSAASSARTGGGAKHRRRQLPQRAEHRQPRARHAEPAVRAHQHVVAHAEVGEHPPVLERPRHARARRGAPALQPVTSAPANCTRPASGRSWPVSRLNSVVLPAPLGPMTDSNSPPRSSKPIVVHGRDAAEPPGQALAR